MDLAFYELKKSVQD
jgi:hypothetical protein